MNNDCIYLFGFIPLNETDECFRRRMAQRRARLNDLYGTNRQRQQIEADRQLDLRGLDAARDVELADRGLNPDATDQVALTELRNLLTASRLRSWAASPGSPRSVVLPQRSRWCRYRPPLSPILPRCSLAPRS